MPREAEEEHERHVLAAKHRQLFQGEGGSGPTV